jgi:hypothetical protein
VNDDPYGDEQLVGLYDLDNPAGDDHAYYRALADELNARRILDFGCGTADLRMAGFDGVTIRGGWRGEPLTADARLLVFRTAVS